MQKNVPAIYFYNKNKEVVYVGKTYDIRSRHRQHVDRYDYCIEDYDSLTVQYYNSKIILPTIELFYISLFQPLYNQKECYSFEYNYERQY